MTETEKQEGRRPPFCTSVKRSSDGPATGEHQLSNGSDGQSLPSLKHTPPMLMSLPTIARVRADHKVFLVHEDVDAFLQMDLDVSRLNDIHGYFWMLGRPLNARPLQRQKMMGFGLVPTEQADLHLLKYDHTLLVKPLPEYMLDYEFWSTYLCSSKELHKSACGFLLSYVWLICSPLDMELAREADLLPTHVTWPWWKNFVTEFSSRVDMNALDQVNKRYQFGELRLGRVNSIYRYRFFHTHYVRGYLYSYNRYGPYFQRNFGWLFMVFAMFSLVLSAMQVAVAIPQLNNSTAFQNTTYGFVVFSAIMVAAVIALIAILFSSMYLFNMVAAISQFRAKKFRRKQLARDRAGTSNS